MIFIRYELESFMEEVYWKVISGSAFLGEWRKKDCIEGEAELWCSCVGVSAVSLGDLQLGWSFWNVTNWKEVPGLCIPRLTPIDQWVIGCRLTMGKKCDFGRGVTNERTQLRVVSSQRSQQLGLWMSWFWREDLDSTPQIWIVHYRWSQDFESWVYKRIIIPNH